ncbi:KEOPS complex subunit Cgi121 [Halovenus salina]|uniref:KEOPS complex subunit Cgi121 n=1 Tax=Halovenus salina TaxID=1510225 RepID=A0ABD5W9E3_9EURY|nr:KEOPS complex subunit Cgi121 [Halovenus salina]
MQVIEGTADVDDIDRFVSRLDAIGEDYDATVQAFDARYVVSRDHLNRAVEVAHRERDRGNAIAEDPGVEILLYAAGRRQIRDALEMGISKGTSPVVAVVVGGDETAAAGDLRELLEPGETLGEYDPERVRSFFDISERELDATTGDLADLICERVAMLVVDR